MGQILPAEERVAWQAIRDAQQAAWPAPAASLTVTQGRQVTIEGANDWQPSFDPAPLTHSTVNRLNVAGQWSIPASPIGTILYVHGAASIGSVESYHQWADDLCIASSASVFNLEYRRPPEFQVADAVDDVLAAMAYLDANNHPVSRMVLAGDSSGAAPVLAALIARRDAGLPPPAGAYLLCPKTDYSNTPVLTPPFDRDPDTCLAQHAFDGYFETVPATDLRASPYRANLTVLPSVLIHDSTGDNGSILAGARALRDKLLAAGNDCTYREWDTVPHIWPTFGAAFAYSREAASEAGDWVKKKLRSGVQV